MTEWQPAVNLFVENPASQDGASLFIIKNAEISEGR
jgi:hypothetical protein